MAAQPTSTLGNWSVGQIYRHLALAIDSMQKPPIFGFPAPVRWLFRLLMLKRMTTKTLRPGFKLPKKASALIPDETTTGAGLEQLRDSIARVKQNDERGDHGGFGKLTREQWDAFQLRHCEMHMSFIVSAESTAS